jgi:hypothetical protein
VKLTKAEVKHISPPEIRAGAVEIARMWISHDLLSAADAQRFKRRLATTLEVPVDVGYPTYTSVEWRCRPPWMLRGFSPHFMEHLGPPAPDWQPGATFDPPRPDWLTPDVLEAHWSAEVDVPSRSSLVWTDPPPVTPPPVTTRGATARTAAWARLAAYSNHAAV